jgi:hypothetical protein
MKVGLKGIRSAGASKGHEAWRHTACPREIAVKKAAWGRTFTQMFIDMGLGFV